VEAGRIELPSATADNREHSCFFTFYFVSSSPLRTAQLRRELEAEYTRTLPTRAQKAMSIFELSVYSPTIEEMWKDTGIRRLKVEGAITGNWSEVLEAVIYKTSKYLAQ
jgi:hypothetical protein